jgi:hypothetical protein
MSDKLEDLIHDLELNNRAARPMAVRMRMNAQRIIDALSAPVGSTAQVDYPPADDWDECYPASTAQGAEPDMRHPKIQHLIGMKARREIELRIIESIIDDPEFEAGPLDNDYWTSLHDKVVALKAAALTPQAAQGAAEQILGEQWDAEHGCAPRGIMGVTVGKCIPPKMWVKRSQDAYRLGWADCEKASADAALTPQEQAEPDKTIDDAPCHYNAEEASAWVSGYEDGHRAALIRKADSKGDAND